MFRGLGFWVQGFGVYGCLGFRVLGLSFRVQGVPIRVPKRVPG